MGSKWVMVLVLFIFVSLQGCLSQISGCWDEERVTLLQLKHFFNDPNCLQDWVEGDRHNNSDCCQWGAVSCNESTGRVIRLDLLGARGWGLREGYLNASLFSAFEQLEWLDLSFNSIAGFVDNGGLDKLSRLRNLEYLYLGINMFNNDILSSLNALPSLTSLYLHENRLNETVDLQVLHSCQNLTNLDLSNNKIEKVVIPKGFDKLSTLTNLELLDLGGNMLNNDIFSSLNALPSLTSLSLSDNSRLNETVDLQGLESSKNLTKLDLSSNQIEKVVFPKGLDSLNNLADLDVSYNPIEKFISPKGSKGLRKLKTLYLHGLNVINGSSLLQSMGSFPSLKTLYLTSSKFSDSTTNRDYLHNLTNVEELILDESFLHISLLQSIAAFTSLNRLSMSSCHINGILGFQGLPNFKNLTHLNMNYSSLNINVLQIIREMTSLEILSLSNCGLQDTLSLQGLCEVVHLQELHLSYNNLTGTLPSCFANLTSLRVLDVSSNKLTGDISISPVKSLISIQELRLSNNHFQIPVSLEPFFNLSKLKRFYGENNEIYAETESHSSTPKFQLNTIMLSCCGDGGKLPEFLHHQHDLREVDLSHNNLTGEFPNWLLENNTKLEYLVLANNSLAGLFQLPNHSLIGLATLNISHNHFQGHIPKEIGKYLPSLTSLNLSRNAFNGNIPSSIGDMNSLQSLDLSFNQLSGKIPDHLAEGCTSLQLLVLSNNNIQGQIFSTNFHLTNLWRLQLDSNNFTGRIPDSLSKASSLAGLYLSDNKISGGIPSWLGNISSLEDIIMPNNHLEGPIPLEFCRLDNLEVLDLTGNNISGSLPSCFSPPSITQVHLSKNRLDGQLKEAFYNSSSLVTLDLGYNRLDGSIPTWIGRLTHLTYLTLSNNNFECEVPTQLCKLKQLRLVDISHNNLYGHLPLCLDVTALHDSDHDIVSPSSISMPPADGPISNPSAYAPDSGPPMRKEETVEFRTKSNSYFYQGKVLTGMSGIDLSCNKLTGLIPQQIGNLTRIRTLNLSHNNFTGPIPLTFAKLQQIESLDLSYNNLNGEIPHQLVELDSLSFISVAHNNLSGNIPTSPHFCTLGDNGFDGNPFLYGLTLSKSCNGTKSPSPMPRAAMDNGEDNDLFDMDIFYISFTVSYIIVLLGIAAVLYINPYWRRSWFYFVETRMTSCYYFVVDNLPRRLRH